MAPLPPRVPLSSLFKSASPEDLFERDDSDDTDSDTDDEDDHISHTATHTQSQHAGQASTSGLTSSSASAASSTIDGTPGQSLGAQSKANAGAIAGGLIGGLICLAAIVFFFWRWRTKRDGPKVRLEIDSTSPLNGEPPEYDHRRSNSLPHDYDDQSPLSSPTAENSALTDGHRPSHFWQVHNASSSSLPAFQSSSVILPASKSDMSELKKGFMTEEEPAVSRSFAKEAIASSSSAKSPPTSFLFGTIRSTDRTSYSGSEDFSVATQVEMEDLRRRVELLKQENAQLAEDREKQSSSESPPAYNEKA